MRRILVSGCLGTVAIKTINYLLDNYIDIEIIGFDDLSGNPISRQNEFIKSDRLITYYPNNPFSGDMSRTIRKIFALHKIDYILHLAANTSISDTSDNPLECVDNNIRLTIELLEYAKTFNVENFVFASSSSVYGEMRVEHSLKGFSESAECRPISNYAISKITAENFIKQYHYMYGLNYTILRYNNILANIEYARSQKPFIALVYDRLTTGQELKLFGNGNIIRQYVSVNDIVEANINALFNTDMRNNIFNISGHDRVSLNQIVQYMVIKMFEMNIGIVFDNNRISRITTLADKRKDDIQCNYVNTDKYANIIGQYNPMNIYDMIDSYVEWRLKNIY